MIQNRKNKVKILKLQSVVAQKQADLDRANVKALTKHQQAVNVSNSYKQAQVQKTRTQPVLKPIVYARAQSSRKKQANAVAALLFKTAHPN